MDPSRRSRRSLRIEALHLPSNGRSARHEQASESPTWAKPVPRAKGVMPAATDAAAPALDPPGVFSRFQGLRVIPVSGLSPTGLQPNSLVVVFPIDRKSV